MHKMVVELFEIFVLFSIQITYISGTLSVETKYGTVHGHIKSVRGQQIREFWGIPYANPPVGHFRFKRPTPLQTGKYNSRTFGIEKQPSCYQHIYKTGSLFPGRGMWIPKANVSEDCLYLNIWSPVTTNKLPVLVWIHGGSFTVGSSTLDLYDGKFLSSMNDVVVVSVNYRLGAIGFIHIGVDNTVGNLGLLDQQIALKWIHENIKYFSGDPSRVTLFGSSAGGASVAYHFLIPSSWPYFHNAMMQGGSVLGKWASYTQDEVISRSKKVAKLVRCEGSDNEIYTCLMKADARELSLAQWQVGGDFNDVPLGPFPDGQFIPNDPIKLIRNGRIKNSSLIAGFNKDEGMVFLQNSQSFRREIEDEHMMNYLERIFKPMKNLILENVLEEYSSTFFKSNATNIMILDDLVGDVVIKCPVLDFASHYSNAGNKVFVYSYEHVSSGNPWPDWMGVLHAYEIDHFFGLPFDESLKYTDSERQLSLNMMTAFSNFARTGNPNKATEDAKGGLVWPLYSDNQRYKAFTTTTPEDSALPLRRCAFWRGVDAVIQCSDTTSCRSTYSIMLGILAAGLYSVSLI